jgi:hypothetical protein
MNVVILIIYLSNAYITNLSIRQANIMNIVELYLNKISSVKISVCAFRL